MLKFEAGVFADAYQNIAMLENTMRVPTSWLNSDNRQEIFAKKFEALGPRLESLGMKVSKHRAQLLMTLLRSGHNFADPNPVTVLQQYLANLREDLTVELWGRVFYGPLADYEKYYDRPKLFGDEVFKNFGSATEDIYEAGMCLAFERGTACVMHLMRVQELGLKVLAATLGVTEQNDWGSYLREIETELDKRTKASGKRSSDEQFYAEAAAVFGRLRLAYRNPSMHPDKSYSPERAEQILLAAKDFMSHLAKRLCEPSVSTGLHP